MNEWYVGLISGVNVKYLLSFFFFFFFFGGGCVLLFTPDSLYLHLTGLTYDRVKSGKVDVEWRAFFETNVCFHCFVCVCV